jgi:hypothetical protein
MIASAVTGLTPGAAGAAGAAEAAGTAGAARAAAGRAAVPTPGPDGIAFYTPPAGPPPGAHGDLVSYRPTTVDLGPDAPAADAWTVLYHSTDGLDRPVYVTGTVLVPTAPATGTRPVISYAVGTHGLAQRCAPSLQMGAGTDYEAANIAAALAEGYAVVATDYAGYTTGGSPTYIIGAAEGHAVLDIVRAASQVPGAGVAADAPTALWGYSQGGQAAAWAGELQPSYAPGLQLKAVAAGGIPADLAATARNLDGATGTSFELMAIAGLAAQYPELPLDAILTAEGQAAFTTLRSQCVFESLPEFRNRRLGDLTGGLGLEQLLALGPVAELVDGQRVGTRPIPVPLYSYHGQADQFVPLAQAYAAKQRYCAAGVRTTFDLYPSEHITTQFQAAPRALDFIAARFAGEPVTDNCAQSTPPPSTALPAGGDFAVALDDWVLDGEVHLLTLNQDVVLPDGSTFSADANLTEATLTGDLAVPDFDAPINLLGFLPLTARIALEPAGTTGTVGLDTEGTLDIGGTARASIVVEQLSMFGIPVTAAQCRTSTPVDFALSFDGPVSALGSGGLAFTGTTTIPTVVGCENDFIGAFVGLFMTAPGNAYEFTVRPPGPVPA